MLGAHSFLGFALSLRPTTNMDPSDSATDFTLIDSTITPDDPGSSGSRPEKKIPTIPRVDSYFNFQLVVFQVYSTSSCLETSFNFVAGWRYTLSSDPKWIRGPGNDF